MVELMITTRISPILLSGASFGDSVCLTRPLVAWLSVMASSARSKFREETPPEKVIRWLIWAAEGFMKRQSDLGRVDIEQLDTEFTELVLFIRQHCYKEEALQ